jgi:hypothetical protein
MSLTYVTDLYHLVKSTKSSPSIEDLQALGQFLNLQSLPADIIDFFKERITLSPAFCLEEEVDFFCLTVSDMLRSDRCVDIRCEYPGVLDVSLDS